MKRRVVITGVGVVSPLGNDATTFWNSLLEGKSGISPITSFDASDYPTQIAGEVKDFNPEDYMDKKRYSTYRPIRSVWTGCCQDGCGGRQAGNHS